MKKIKKAVKKAVKRIVKAIKKILNWDEIVRPASDYGKATAWMRKKASSKASYTKGDLVEFFKSIGKTQRAAIESAVVMLSPREKSTRGDCRGNLSNPWGHVAYNEKLNRRVVGGRKEVQRFRFRLREVAMEARKRGEVNAVASKKVATKVASKSRKGTKAKA